MTGVRFEQKVWRRFVATVAATGAASLWSTLARVPDWLSPSSLPFDLEASLLGMVVHLGFAVPLNLWLLPVCLVVDWVMSRRRVQHGAAVALFAVVAFGVISAPLVAAMANERPFGETWVSLGSHVVQCALYLATWMAIAHGGRSKVAMGAAQAVDSATKPTIDEQVKRVTDETFALVGVGLWALLLSGAAAALDAFGGDGEYRLQSIDRSSRVGMQACRVVYLTPGGALGDVYQEVYLVDAGETWTPERRGLLVWQGDVVDVPRVCWVDDRHLQVYANNPVSKLVRRDFRAFSRRGFQVSTVVDSTR